MNWLLGFARIASWTVVVGLHCVALVLACDIGLHYSAGTVTPPNMLAWSLTLLTAIVASAVVADWLIYRWSTRTRTSRSWVAVAVIGAATSVLAGLLSALAATLLASATWGQAAGGDLAERDRLVGFTVVAWIWPLTFLIVGLVLIGASFTSTSRVRPVLACVGTSVTAASPLAALVCTALLSA